MSNDIIKQFLIEIPQENNEGIHRVVEELSQKARIATPGIYRSNGRSRLLEMMPAGAMSVGNDKAVILLNQPMLSGILGDKVDFASYAAISDEIKGFVAHEIGHIKRGDLKAIGIANAARFTPLGCMFGAMAGLYMIRDHQQKQKDKAKENVLSPEAVEEALKLPKEIKSPTLETAKTVALYTVAAGAGLTGGIMAARGMRHHMEYACDAFSKELLGSGKPLASALEKCRIAFEQSYDQLLKNMPQRKQEAMKSLIKILEGMFHPPIPDRIARLTR